jgi:tRNA1(Val) A37 N6-methylase TrmN6
VNHTAGTLLGGRLRYHQPDSGYRTGLEPVLLAASIPARAGDAVLEAGCGAGAGLLCLAARVPGITGTGVERDPALADLAAENFIANGFATVRAIAGDITVWRADAPFDHAFANPPWHEADSTASPSPARRAAKQAAPGLLAAWVAAMARALRPRGTLSLILPAACLTEALMALAAAKCRGTTLLPLWPAQGKSAKLLILRSIRLGNGPDRVVPGLTLHDAESLTPAAEAILRHAAPLGS